MPNYVRRSGDVKYRKVNIQNASVPNYADFTSPGESIAYSDVQVVEVLRADGSTELFHEGGVEIANYCAAGPDKFLISQNIPRARMWMRRSDGTGIAYKVPVDLPAKSGSVEFRVPCGVQGMELFGDKYFEAVYQMRR